MRGGATAPPGAGSSLWAPGWRGRGRRANYDADNLEAAKTWLLKAMHISPAQHTLRFNVATTMQVLPARPPLS